MSSKKTFLTILLFSLFTAFAQKEKPFSISGVIIDSLSKAPVSYASVVFYHLPDSNLYNGVVSDVSGNFKMNNIPKGFYLMKINFMGYKKVQFELEIQNENIVFKKPFLLQPLYNTIEGVEISTSKIYSSKTEQGTILNVKDAPEGLSGSILDIIKQQTGVSIDESGNVYIRGNANILILFDGVPVNSSFLQTTSASSLESIEIITTPDSKYDAEGTGGIINIVSKKNMVSGLSGEISLKIGIPFQINGGVQLNLAKPKYSLVFQYYGNYNPEDIHSVLFREIKSNDISVNQIIHNKKIQYLHQASLFFNYKWSPKEQISLSLNTSFPTIDQIQNIRGEQEIDSTESSYLRRNLISFQRKTFYSALTFEKVFVKKKHELSSVISFSRIKGNRPAEYYNQDLLIQKSFGGGAPTNASIQVDYFNSIGKIDKVEMGVKWFYRWNDFQYAFFDLDLLENQWIFNTQYSNDLQHKEQIASAYLMASDSLSKRLFLKVGARIEYNHSELVQLTLNDTNSYQYLSPFPFLMLKYQLNPNNQFVFQINRRITRPTYPQLNPYINLIDQLTYETGNKNVQPEVIDKAELSFSFVDKRFIFNLNLYSSITQRFITQVSLLSNDNQLAITYVNGDKQFKNGSDLDLKIIPNKRIYFQIELSLFYTQTTGVYNEVDLSSNNFSWKGNLKLNLNPWGKGEFQFAAVYNAPIQMPQFNIEDIYYFNISYTQKLWGDKLWIQLSIVDLLNTQKWVIHSDNLVYSLDNTSKSETRKLWLGITYRFNSYKAPKINKQPNPEDDNGMIKF